MPAQRTMKDLCVLFVLSKATLPPPSQQGKEGLGKGNCTDSSVPPNNPVRHWTGWVEVASPPEGERATLVILVWPQTLACFFWGVSVLCVVPHKKYFFLTRNEFLGVKKAQFTPYSCPSCILSHPPSVMPAWLSRVKYQTVVIKGHINFYFCMFFIVQFAAPNKQTRPPHTLCPASASSS
jgi:hypothetical protein